MGTDYSSEYVIGLRVMTEAIIKERFVSKKSNNPMHGRQCKMKDEPFLDESIQYCPSCGCHVRRRELEKTLQEGLDPEPLQLEDQGAAHGANGDRRPGGLL